MAVTTNIVHLNNTAAAVQTYTTHHQHKHSAAAYNTRIIRQTQSEYATSAM
jgi:hypothetical protein